MIKLIVFDFDGVIENVYQKHYDMSAKQIRDLTEKEFNEMWKGNIHEERDKLKHRDTGYDIKKHFSNYKKTLKIKRETKKILINLSKKYTLGIISSAKEEGTIHYLKNNGLQDAFGFVYGCGIHRLKTEKFKLLLKNYNLNKNEMVFVTDTLGDIKEANEIGIQTIAIDSGYHKKEILQKGNPRKIISNLNELDEAIQRI